MDGGIGSRSAYAGAVVIRRWLVIGSGRCPDGRLGASVMSTERVSSGVPAPVPGAPSDTPEGLWADATCFTFQTYETSEVSHLEAFLQKMNDLERAGATILDAEAWQGIKRAAARRAIRLQSEQAVTG